ncbi:hypothetical protein SDC49_21085 [Lactobacillus sp. R2/2]|nr:hypothetical protein [Lactobacillus sp. R2/2]
MNLKITTELKDFLLELGYPFNSISGLLDSSVMDKYLNAKWIKNSHVFEMLDKEANDKQLLKCSDVRNFTNLFLHILQLCQAKMAYRQFLA